MKAEECDDDGEIGFLAVLRREDGRSHGEKPEEMGNHSPGDEPEQRHYELGSIGAVLTIRQLPSQGLSFQLWPAASSLVSLLDQNPSLLLASLPTSRRCLPNLNILELGAGTGLVGIAAAAVLGARVTITDMSHVLPNLLFNAQANACAVAARGGVVEVRQLEWGRHEEDAAGLGGASEKDAPAFDLVMASDVVYHDHLFDPLLQTLQFFVTGEVVFVLAHLRRWKKDAVFFRKARKLFEVSVIHTDPPLPGSRVGITVYRFVQKARAAGG
ncbi:unnamed protein product [Spirodela intermedia]|uniref:Uncharacterized protein n=1 Tax=Spirodela intermedia TaxID=51605 RepID=A0A7I8K9X6_SPIIN|nr:unnamed protein product [Spirodela intermedia]